MSKTLIFLVVTAIGCAPVEEFVTSQPAPRVIIVIGQTKSEQPKTQEMVSLIQAEARALPQGTEVALWTMNAASRPVWSAQLTDMSIREELSEQLEELRAVSKDYGTDPAGAVRSVSAWLAGQGHHPLRILLVSDLVADPTVDARGTKVLFKPATDADWTWLPDGAIVTAVAVDPALAGPIRTAWGGDSTRDVVVHDRTRMLRKQDLRLGTRAVGF